MDKGLLYLAKNNRKKIVELHEQYNDRSMSILGTNGISSIKD